jgi:transaldolase
VVEATPSHNFLVQLSRITTSDAVAKATAWTDTDEGALSTVITRITQSKTKESIEKARRLRSLADRIQVMLDAILLCTHARFLVMDPPGFG